MVWCLAQLGLGCGGTLPSCPAVSLASNHLRAEHLLGRVLENVASAFWGENSTLVGIAKLSLPGAGAWVSAEIRRQGRLKSASGAGSGWPFSFGEHIGCAQYARAVGTVHRTDQA